MNKSLYSFHGVYGQFHGCETWEGVLVSLLLLWFNYNLLDTHWGHFSERMNGTRWWYYVKIYQHVWADVINILVSQCNKFAFKIKENIGSYVKVNSACRWHSWQDGRMKWIYHTLTGGVFNQKYLQTPCNKGKIFFPPLYWGILGI